VSSSRRDDSPIKSYSSSRREDSPTKSYSSSRREDSPTKSFSRIYQDKDGSSRSEEFYNRDATEKKTTIIDGEPTDGNYTRTTITEKEETIEKREVLKFTEVGNGGVSSGRYEISG
jgi:hypothetical protein